MEISANVQAMLDKIQCPVGGVVHTLEGKQPVKATKTESGWEIEKEGWVYKR